MPQRKKKPITVGKRTSYMTGKRPVSAKPSQASKVRAAKKTTSSKYRSRRQAASKAKVTESQPTLKYQARNRKITEAGEGQTGLRKYSGRAKVTTGRGRSGPKLPKLPAKSTKVTRGGGTGRTAMPKESAARKAARLANRAAKGYRGAGGSTMSKVGSALGKMAGKALVPLAMANEVRTMVQRQKRYNAQKAAMKRRKKK